MMNKTDYNAMVVFERAVHLEGYDIWGFLYNTNEKYPNNNLVLRDEFNNNVNEYVAYLLALNDLIEQGGHVIYDKNHWKYSDGRVVDISDWDIDMFISGKDQLKYQIYEFKDCVEVGEHEVDENFIISQDLIQRYMSITEPKEGGAA